MIPYAAYLRVYEPLDSFPPAERERWSRYLAGGPPPDASRGAEAEFTAALTRLLSVPPRPEPADADEQAFGHRLDGVSYICPWRTRLRSWEGLATLRRTLPAELIGAFLPADVIERADRDQLQWRADHPGLRSAILTCTWTVPLPWFLLFEPQERRLLLGARRSTPGGALARTEVSRSLSYLTRMARARQRLARTLRVVRRALDEGPATVGLEELGRWLEEFHPHALVELDYGGLVHLLDDDELAGDDSVAALTEAVGALASGDAAGAAGRYERVTARWRRVAMLENAN